MTPWQGLFPMGRKPKYHKFRRPTGGRKLGQCRRPAGMLEVRTISALPSDHQGRWKCTGLSGTILAITTLVRIDQVDQDLLDVLIELGELERRAIGRRAYDLGGQTAVQVLSFTAKLHH